jgi:hypothetical protein
MSLDIAKCSLGEKSLKNQKLNGDMHMLTEPTSVSPAAAAAARPAELPLGVCGGVCDN